MGACDTHKRQWLNSTCDIPFQKGTIIVKRERPPQLAGSLVASAEQHPSGNFADKLALFR